MYICKYNKQHHIYSTYTRIARLRSSNEPSAYHTGSASGASLPLQENLIGRDFSLSLPHSVDFPRNSVTKPLYAKYIYVEQTADCECAHCDGVSLDRWISKPTDYAPRIAFGQLCNGTCNKRSYCCILQRCVDNSTTCVPFDTCSDHNPTTFAHIFDTVIDACIQIHFMHIREINILSPTRSTSALKAQKIELQMIISPIGDKQRTAAKAIHLHDCHQPNTCYASSDHDICPTPIWHTFGIEHCVGDEG